MDRLARIGALVCGLALGYVAGGVAAAFPLPKFPACPTFDDCWRADPICDRVPYRQRYACRNDLRRRCMDRADRCRGGLAR